MKPSYEEPVETAEDLIKRDIIPFYAPGGELIIQVFAASPNPIYRKISQRLVIAKDWDDYYDMVQKVTSTGLFADIGTTPTNTYEEEYKDWYRSSEAIAGDNPYSGHMANKKWPLKKVL